MSNSRGVNEVLKPYVLLLIQSFKQLTRVDFQTCSSSFVQALTVEDNIANRTRKNRLRRQKRSRMGAVFITRMLRGGKDDEYTPEQLVEG